MSTKPQARYQCFREDHGGEHVQSMIGAHGVRVISPDGKTHIEVAYIGAGQFHVSASGRMFISADTDRDLVIKPQQFSSHRKRPMPGRGYVAQTKNVARKG